MRPGAEDGFSLIELLVAILVIGILAAIALPNLLGQDVKAEDADAKQQARGLQTAMRICGLDQGGSFTDPRPCNLKRLREIEPSIPRSGVSAKPGSPPGGLPSGRRRSPERASPSYAAQMGALSAPAR